MNYQWLLLALCCILIGCSTPRESLEKGDYLQAYNLSLKALNQDRNPEENKEVLIAALEAIAQQYDSEIQALKSSPAPEDQERAFLKIQNLLKKVAESKVYTAPHFQDLSSQLEKESCSLRKSLAHAYFEKGEELLAFAAPNNHKGKARQAYNKFVKARHYGSEAPQLDSLKQVSHQLAQVIYVIEMDAPFDIMHHWEINRKFEDMEDFKDEFTQVYYDPIAKVKEVDCHLEIRFDPLDIDIDEDSDEKVFQKEIKVDDETEEIEGEVTIQTHTKTAEWEININVLFASDNCTIRERRFTETTVSEIKRIEWDGDKRAIPDHYLDQDKEELPDDDEMAEILIDKLYDRVVWHIF